MEKSNKFVYRDSEQTIICFQNHVHADTSWQEEILQCQLKASSNKNSDTVKMK